MLTFGETFGGLTLLGGMMSAMGGLQTGNAQRQAANYNAAMDERAADLALAAGEINADNIRLQAERQRAQSLAGMAASGVNIAEGSPIIADAQAAKYQARDIALTRHAAQNEAWKLRAGAQIQRWQGKQAQKMSRWNAAGTLLTSSANAAYNYALLEQREQVPQPYYKPYAGVS